MLDLIFRLGVFGLERPAFGAFLISLAAHFFSGLEGMGMELVAGFVALLLALLELLLQGLYLGLHVKCCLAEMLKLLHQLPALISHLVCFRLFVLP